MSEENMTQAQTATTRLSQDELLALMQTARKEFEKVSDYGGNVPSAIIALLLVDFLLAFREQNQLLADLLARGRQA